MSLDTIIFFVSAVVAVFGATMMIAQRNPVASVLYLILSLVAQAVVYVQLAALFMGVILMVVYAGAIMVLFLFVIMLLNIRGTEELGPNPPTVSRFTKIVVGFLITVELIFIVKEAPFGAVVTGVMGMSAEEFGTVAQVARKMFTDYVYPFELAGVLMLIAVIGAVVLSKRDKAEGTASIGVTSQGGEAVEQSE